MNTRTIILVLSILLLSSLTISFFLGKTYSKYKQFKKDNIALQEQVDSLLCLVDNSPDTVEVSKTIYKTVVKVTNHPIFVHDTLLIDSSNVNTYVSEERDSLYSLKETIIVDGCLIDVERDLSINFAETVKTIEIRDTVVLHDTKTVKEDRDALLIGASYNQIENIQNNFMLNVGYQFKNRHQIYVSKTLDPKANFAIGYNFLIPLFKHN